MVGTQPKRSNYVIFRDKWIWKSVDCDGSSGFQCVDLARQYMKEVLNIDRKMGNANQWRSNIYKVFDTQWERMPGTKDLMQWDIIFSKNWQYGHVAIVNTITKDGIMVLEQNGSGVNSGDWLWPNAVRIHKYSPLFFYIVWRSIKIIENYTLELKYIENKLMNWSDKDTLDYLKSIRRK